MTTLSPEFSAEHQSRDDRPTSLKQVLQAIPPERYDNPTWRGLLGFGRDAVLYAALVWGLIVIDTWWAVGLLWALSGLILSGLFIIGHDAAHGALFKSKRLNSIIGHIAMLPAWHVYEGWILGHNRIHHAHTCRQSMDFVWHPLTPEEYAQLSPLKRWRHRLEWSWAGSLPYYLREVWWNKMIAFDPPAKWVKGIRRDRIIIGAFVLGGGSALAVLGWFAHSSVLGAAWMILKVLVVPFLAYTFMIGWVVHIHHIDPEIRWWPQRQWNKFRGQVEGTTVIYAPRWMDFFLHKIFFHVAHHVDMRIPYYHLPAACEDIRAAYPDAVVARKLRIRDFLTNVRQCKLYNFETGRWLNYDQARKYMENVPVPS